MITSGIERAHEGPVVQATTALGRLGAWSMGHRRLVVAGWVMVLFTMMVAGRLAGSQFKSDLTGGNSQSQRAAFFLSEHFLARAWIPLMLFALPRRHPRAHGGDATGNAHARAG